MELSVPRVGEASGVFECSFYTKSRRQVKRLIAGGGVYTCDECTELYNEIIEERFPKVETFGLQEELFKPKEIRDFLDQYVIGQDTAKKVLAVAVYNHYEHITSEQTRIGRSRQGEEPVEAGESSVLLIGPTGCERTYLVQTLAKMLNASFVMTDATTLTEVGYVGEDVEDILPKPIQAADFDIRKTETGIIYVDETDRVARKPENPSVARDVSGEGVQQTLFRIPGGIVAPVPPQGGRKHPHQDFPQIDTIKMLSIVDGAFAGLDEIINSCIGERSLGSNVNASTRKEATDPFSKVHPEDLHKFGLIPESIGRPPMTSTVSPLGHETLNQVLVEPRNTLTKQLTRLLELDGVQLDFTDETIDTTVELALKRGTGARGLWAVLGELLLDVMLEVPSAEDVAQVVVTREVVLGRAQPELVASSRMARRRDLSA